MNESDELRELRNRARRLRDELENLRSSPSDEHGDLVGRTTHVDAAYPTGINKYYEVKVARITGPDKAGSGVTLADDPDSSVITALCLGPNVPPEGGEYLISTSPEGRYVFNS